MSQETEALEALISCAEEPYRVKRTTAVFAATVKDEDDDCDHIFMDLVAREKDQNPTQEGFDCEDRGSSQCMDIDSG